MKTKTIPITALQVFWGLAFVWGVIYVNNLFFQVVSNRPFSIYVYDILSDLVFLLVGFLPVIWAPHFFGYQIGSIQKHGKMLLGMLIFFIAAPLLYRVVVGETPFGANTWFFEGVVVPLAEESCFRGVLLSLLLWGFGKIYAPRLAETLALMLSAILFASAHLNNLGHYPAGFIFFQVGFSLILGLAFGYTRIKTGSIYPSILLHSLFNLAGTL
jgi:membrane protease YdiL (CAAX protease family)